jgi:hypothetical protein
VLEIHAAAMIMEAARAMPRTAAMAMNVFLYGVFISFIFLFHGKFMKSSWYQGTSGHI